MILYLYPPILISPSVGGATLAEQIIQTALLTSIDADTSALVLKDFSTSVKQDTGNSILSSIDTKLTSPLVVSGPLTNAELRATSVPVSVGNFPATQPVSGTVSINNYPLTQAVSLASIPLAPDAATQTTLSELNLKIPSALGQLANAASLAVTLSTEQQSLINEIEINTDAVKITSGGISDAAVSNPALSGSVTALLKGVLTLINSTNTKLDAIEVDLSSEFLEFNTQVVSDSPEVTFNAPAGAKKMVIQNSLEASGPIRFVPSSGTASSNIGFYLGVGQSTSEIPAGTFKAIATNSGEYGDVTVIWFV